MNNLPRPMKSCFLLTLACAVPALGQMMYNPPASGGGAPAPPPHGNVLTVRLPRPLPPRLPRSRMPTSLPGREMPSPCTAMKFLS